MSIPDPMTDIQIPKKEDLDAAWERIRPHVHRTPIVKCSSLESRLKRPLHLKAENLQKTGSFKIRGALNHVLSLDDDDVSKGVVTYSSGNHAQAVALAARIRGVPATIVMPPSAPGVKREATEGYGARVILEGETASERKAVARAFSRETGAAIVPPYDDFQVVCGQASVAREIVEDCPQVHTVYVPVGGGGLIAGTCLAVHHYGSGIRIVGVEPEQADAMNRSLNADQVEISQPGETIADGLKPDFPGRINFEIVKRYVERIILVTEGEIKDAMELLITRTKLLVEPSGAAAFAGALFWGSADDGETACVISGGNVDIRRIGEILQ